MFKRKYVHFRANFLRIISGLISFNTPRSKRLVVFFMFRCLINCHRLLLLCRALKRLESREGLVDCQCKYVAIFLEFLHRWKARNKIESNSDPIICLYSMSSPRFVLDMVPPFPGACASDYSSVQHCFKSNG